MKGSDVTRFFGNAATFDKDQAIFSPRQVLQIVSQGHVSHSERGAAQMGYCFSSVHMQTKYYFQQEQRYPRLCAIKKPVEYRVSHAFHMKALSSFFH